MFVLAHLSDPHLGPVPKARLIELLNKRGLGLINWQFRRRRFHRADVLAALVDDLTQAAPDHTVVSGDLVNLSLAAEFAPARQWLVELGKPANVTVVPGNHDAYVRSAADEAVSCWGDYMADDGATGAQVRPAGPFPFVRRRGDVALIGLRTGVPTGPFMATGRLGHGQLARLAKTLADLSTEQIFRIVVIHHPPVSPLSERLKRLVDGEQLRTVIAQHGAELVIHGHRHVSSTTWLEGPAGPVPVVGVPSASAALEGHDEPAAYNLYRIEGSAQAWRCEVTSRGFKRGHSGVTHLASRTLGRFADGL